MLPGLGKIAEVEKAARRIEKLAPVAKAIKAVDHVATAVKETRIAGYVDEIATTVGDVGRLLDIVPSNITAAPMPSMSSADRLQPELMALDKVKVDVSVSLDPVRMDVAPVATGAGMRERVLANIESSRAVREARSQSGSAAYSKRERVLQNVVEQRRIRSARAEGGWSGYKAREADVGDAAPKFEVRNGYTYVFDDSGRVNGIYGELVGNAAQGRNQLAQSNAGGKYRLKSDEGGHFVARRFNGPTDDFNHFAQDRNFNRGAYKKLENLWQKAIDQGKTVIVDIRPSYLGDSLRPNALDIMYTIDGVPYSKTFNNRHGGK